MADNLAEIANCAVYHLDNLSAEKAQREPPMGRAGLRPAHQDRYDMQDMTRTGTRGAPTDGSKQERARIVREHKGEVLSDPMKLERVRSVSCAADALRV